MKLSSLYTSKFEHINLLKKPNVSLNFFPDFNRDKVLNQNEKYLVIWDLNKENIILTKETSESKNLLFIDRNDRNKNYSSLIYNKTSSIFSSNILYKNKEWKLKDGNKIALRDYNLGDVQEITFMIKLEEYLSSFRDKILVGFSNGYVALFKFNSRDCINILKAHKKKINDIIHLKEYNYNYFATCSDNFTVKIWDFTTNILINELKGHFNKVLNLHYLKYMDTRYIASCSEDAHTIIWNFVTRERLISLNNESSIRKSIYLYDYLPATIINSNDKNKIFIWSYNIPSLDFSAASVTFKELKYYGNEKLNKKLSNNTSFSEIVDTSKGNDMKIDCFDQITTIITDTLKKNKDKLYEYNDHKTKNYIVNFLKHFKENEKYKIEKEISFHCYKNISSKQSDNSKNDTSKQSDNSKNDTSNQSENLKNDTSKQSENLKNDTSKQSDNSKNDTSNQSENLKNEKEYANFIYKLINLNTSIDSFSQIKSVIKKINSNQKSVIKNLQIYDNCKSSIFPKNSNFKIFQNLVNSNHYIKYLNVSNIDKIYTFMNFILAVENIYYNEKRFFKLEKENIFIDTKTKSIKIINFYLHFEKSFDWDIKYNDKDNWKLKEEFLKNFFIDFKKFYLNNGNIKIQMEENDFTFDEDKTEKEFLWKYKQTFIFSFLKRFLSNFLKSSKKNKVFGYENKNNNLIKQLTTIEKVKNLLIYFFSKSKSNNKSPEYFKMDNIFSYDKHNDKTKKSCILYIKSLNITVMGFDKIVLHDRNFKVLKDIVIKKESDAKENAYVKSLLYYKEKKKLLVGFEAMGKVIIYDIVDLKELKRISFNSAGSFNNIIHLKGYNGRNDIFACSSEGNELYIFDYQGNILKVIQEKASHELAIKINHLAFSSSLNLISYVRIETNILSELVLLDLNKDNLDSIKIVKLTDSESIMNLQILNNILGQEVLIFCTNNQVFIYKIKNILSKNAKLKDNSLLYSFQNSIPNLKILKFIPLKNIGNNYIILFGENFKSIYIYKLSENSTNGNKEDIIYISNYLQNKDSFKTPNHIYNLEYLSNFDKLTFAICSDNTKFDVYETELQIDKNQLKIEEINKPIGKNTLETQKENEKFDVNTEIIIKQISGIIPDRDDKKLFENVKQIETTKILSLEEVINNTKKKYWLKKTNEEEKHIETMPDNQNNQANNRLKLRSIEDVLNKTLIDYWLKKINQPNNQVQIIIEETKQNDYQSKTENLEEVKNKDSLVKLSIEEMIEEKIKNVFTEYWNKKVNSNK